MVTLGELRRKVQMRLRDYSQKGWEPLELNILINEAQNTFTRDTEILQGSYITDINANQQIYQIKPPPGYRLYRVQSVKIYDASRDGYPIEPVTLTQLDNIDYNWRNTTGDLPLFYLRDFSPTSPLPTNDSMWLYPTPNTDKADGLRVAYSMITQDQMKTDDSPMAAPDESEDAITDWATAEALVLAIPFAGERQQAYTDMSVLYRKRYDDMVAKTSAWVKTGRGRSLFTSMGYYF